MMITFMLLVLVASDGVVRKNRARIEILFPRMKNVIQMKMRKSVK